jgi:hypothetical protein
MTPEEQEHAHALLTRALSDPNWRTASQALDDLMRKLLMVHRLPEAEERLAKRRPGFEPYRLAARKRSFWHLPGGHERPGRLPRPGAFAYSR